MGGRPVYFWDLQISRRGDLPYYVASEDGPFATSVTWMHPFNTTPQLSNRMGTPPVRCCFCRARHCIPRQVILFREIVQGISPPEDEMLTQRRGTPIESQDVTEPMDMGGCIRRTPSIQPGVSMMSHEDVDEDFEAVRSDLDEVVNRLIARFKKSIASIEENFVQAEQEMAKLNVHGLVFETSLNELMRTTCASFKKIKRMSETLHQFEVERNSSVESE